MATTIRALGAGLHQLAADGDAGGAPGFAGFLAHNASAAIASVAATGTTAGVYLFGDAAPDDPAAFVAKARALLGRVDPPGRGPGPGRVRVLWLRGVGRSDPSVVARIELADTSVLAAPCQVRCCGYGVVLAAGCSLTLDGDALIVRRSASADPRAISLITRAGLGRLPADAGAVVRIPLTTGTLGFSLTLAPGDGQRRSGLDTLDVQLRYFFAAAQDPDVPVALADGLASLDYPVFDPTAGDVRVHAQIDPVFPLEPDRSHLGLIPPGATAADQILRSFFVDRLGRPLWLRPVVRDGLRPRLVFAASPTHGPQSGAPIGSNVWTYLCPEGEFEIVDPSGAAPSTDVLAGLSGSEYFRFESGTANRLAFVPHQPALASGFSFGGASPPGSSRAVFSSASPSASPSAAQPGQASLLAHATTSQIYLQGPARTVYYAQPDNSVLWMAGEVDAFLEYMELDAGELPESGPSSAARRSLPIAPYRGIASSRHALLRELEIQALAPVRRKIIYDYVASPEAEPHAPLATPARRAVTTLGLLAEFEPTTNAWISLVLAMPKNRQAPLELVGAGGKQDPKGIAGPLRAALQTNRCFMVVSGGEFSSHGSLANPLVDVEGWSFNLDPARWDRHGTILLFKFNDRPIVDMLADTREWVAGDRFNVDADATRQRIAQLVAEAQLEVQSGGEEAEAPLGEFVRIVESPQWQGVLALQVDLPLSGLPDEIAMLAAGIDASKFKAHHFGVTLAPVEYAFGSEPAMDPSAHFGLIRYREPPGAEPPPGPYDYRVESLMVRFYNSLVVDFSSTVRLELGALFGDPVSATPPPDAPPGDDPRIFKLIGVLERHDGVPTYSFASQKPKLLAPDSHVVSEVVVQRVEQKTTMAPDAAAGGELRGYFQLRGFARFAAQPDLDAFSFGVGAGLDGGGLAFERMLVHMSATVPPAGQEAAVEPSWRFDVAEAICDGNTSQSRPQSLYARFPVKISAFAQGAGAGPAAVGYIPVASPMPESKIGDEWYGLDLELELGSAGALVDNKSLAARLLLAWSPNTGRGPITFVGVRLPGSDGAQKSFKIQGLFDMKIADVALLAHDDGARTSYTMIFRDLAFDLMRLRFPLTGKVNFMLFGDPNITGKPSSLGWYLAYAK